MATKIEIQKNTKNDYQHNNLLLNAVGSLGIRNTLVKDFLIKVGNILDLMFNSVRDYNKWRSL